MLGLIRLVVDELVFAVIAFFLSLTEWALAVLLRQFESFDLDDGKSAIFISLFSRICAWSLFDSLEPAFVSGGTDEPTAVRQSDRDVPIVVYVFRDVIDVPFDL